MNIQLATEKDIPAILEILKQRCEWLNQKDIEQWGEWYYTEMYNKEYFMKKMQTDRLYVAKEKDEVLGSFLLKTEDQDYWEDNESAYYIHHFVTKLGNPNLGIKMLKFMENLAKKNSIHYLRLDCMKTNTRLNEYYSKYGFEERGEGEEPYPYRLWEKIVGR